MHDERHAARVLRRTPEITMMRMPRLAEVALVLLAAAPIAGGAARAQDVQGIELCTRESSMDRRTSCLQSNVQYLQGLIAKNAAAAQQKLNAAASEAGALKTEVGAL